MSFKLNTTESYPEATSEAATNGALISEIDNKLRKLELNRNIYSSELKSVPRKRKSILSSITLNICILVVAAAILFYISTHSFMNMGAALYYATWIFVFYMLIRIGKFIKIYLINMDNNFSRNYRIKHGVSTLVNEEEYCRDVLSKLAIYQENLNNRKLQIENGEAVDADETLKYLDSIPDEFADFKYTAGKILF